MIPVDRLRGIPQLDRLPADRFTWLSQQAEEITLAPGETLLRQGSAGRGFFIIAEGEILLVRQHGDQETVAGRRSPPDFLGEISALTGYPITVTCRAQTACRLLHVSEDVFFELLTCCREFAQTIFKTMVYRATETEGITREMEKMASLGTLAAGLAHELNNPAAAILRFLDRARQRSSTLTQHALDLSAAGADPQAMAALRQLLARAADAPTPDADPLAKTEQEERLADWLDDRGCADAWDAAAVLAGAELSQDDLREFAERCDPAGFRHAIALATASLDVNALLDDAAIAGTRIAKLVGAVKSYSFMDQDTRQVIDVHQGIEDTLTILDHRLSPGVNVERRYDRALPKVTAYGSELNQVWTNLIDNAIDAVGESGTITIDSGRDGDHVVIAVTDDGPGIPDDIRSKIFDPFFTTKGVGEGTGIGLEIAHRIVVARHCGAIDVTSRPGETRFEVSIPIAPPDGAAG